MTPHVQKKAFPELAPRLGPLLLGAALGTYYCVAKRRDSRLRLTLLRVATAGVFLADQLSIMFLREQYRDRVRDAFKFETDTPERLFWRRILCITSYYEVFCPSMQEEPDAEHFSGETGEAIRRAIPVLQENQGVIMDASDRKHFPGMCQIVTCTLTRTISQCSQI